MPDLQSEALHVSAVQVLGDEQLAPVFWEAELVHPSSAWCSHIPFAHWIVAAAAPRILVELGSHTGVSYLAFCQAVEREQLGTKCFAVDTWRGDAHAGFYGDEVYATLNETNQRRFAAFSSLIRSTFDDALDYFAEQSVDLLHIDGLHTYEAVKHDFENWLPKLSDRAVVLFHDTNVRRDDFGVWRLWAELRDQYPSFEFLHGFGLGVLAIGVNAPAAVTALCADPNIAALRDRFGFLGERWEAERLDQHHSAQSARRIAEDHAQYAQALEEARRTAEATIEALRHEQQAASEERRVAAAALNAKLSATEKEVLRLRVEMDTMQLAITGERISLRQAVYAAEREAAQEREKWGRQMRARVATEAKLRAAQRHVAALEESPGWAAFNTLNAFDRRLPLVRRGFRATWWLVTGQATQRRQEHAAREQARRAEAEAQVATAAVIRESALFDPEYYLDHYPDAAESGMAPELHYLLIGAGEDRKPSALFDPEYYLISNPDVAALGADPLLHYIEFGRQEGRQPLPPEQDRLAVNPTKPSRESELGEPTIRALIDQQFPSLRPLPIYEDKDAARSVVIVTDSIGPQSLFGGVGTALIIGTLMAQRLSCKLRVATRADAPDARVFGEVVVANKIVAEMNPDFIYVPLDGSRPLAVGAHDVVITTSWWTTQSSMRSLGTERIIYLLQEDERMFYAFGDQRLRCSEVLNDSRLKLLINTEALYQHFASGPAALVQFERRAAWFTPAFASISPPQWDQERPKKNFFFYARPFNERNLFWRGLEAIEAALEEGVLDGSEWNFYFVGKDVPKMVLPGGIEPIAVSGLSWPDYAAFIATMDLGLSLMDTPHPSYPPIDLAAGGAVVVTSTHGAKINLDQWSRNIICATPTVASLTQGLRRGVALVADRSRRRANHEAGGILTDWQAALEPILAKLLPATSEG